MYKCSVDNNAVTIQWNVNGTLLTNSFNNDLGNISGTTHDSSLIIPGNPELNSTIVTCIASGLVDTMIYINKSNATLFIQGM